MPLLLSTALVFCTFSVLCLSLSVLFVFCALSVLYLFTFCTLSVLYLSLSVHLAFCILPSCTFSILCLITLSLHLHAVIQKQRHLPWYRRCIPCPFTYLSRMSSAVLQRICWFWRTFHRNNKNPNLFPLGIKFGFINAGDGTWTHTILRPLDP